MASGIPNTSDDTSGPLLKDMDHVPTGGVSGFTADLPERENYRLYKRRWIGLVQLALLNIIVSWDVSLPLVLMCSKAFAKYQIVVVFLSCVWNIGNLFPCQ